MWLFLSDSFLSIVADQGDPNLLLVRARAAGDIERVFPLTKVERTPVRDYRYRARIERSVVMKAVANLIERIDYLNFKDTIPADEADRHEAYLGVWSRMLGFQQKRATKSRQPK